MSTWTKEPWSAGEWAVSGPTAAAAMAIENDLGRSQWRVPTTRVCQTKATGQEVVAVVLGGTQERADASAFRIVACVNACVGMLAPEAAVAYLMERDEQLTRLVDDANLVIAKMRAQRDALGEALESYVCKFGNCGSVYVEACAALGMSGEKPAPDLFDSIGLVMPKFPEVRG